MRQDKNFQGKVEISLEDYHRYQEMKREVDTIRNAFDEIKNGGIVIFNNDRDGDYFSFPRVEGIGDDAKEQLNKKFEQIENMAGEFMKDMIKAQDVERELERKKNEAIELSSEVFGKNKEIEQKNIVIQCKDEEIKRLKRLRFWDAIKEFFKLNSNQ